jgi:cytochrome c553
MWDKVKDKLLAAAMAALAAFVAALLGTQANPPAVKIDAPPGVTVQVVR